MIGSSNIAGTLAPTVQLSVTAATCGIPSVDKLAWLKKFFQYVHGQGPTEFSSELYTVVSFTGLGQKVEADKSVPLSSS